MPLVEAEQTSSFVALRENYLRKLFGNAFVELNRSDLLHARGKDRADQNPTQDSKGHGIKDLRGRF